MLGNDQIQIILPMAKHINLPEKMFKTDKKDKTISVLHNNIKLLHIEIPEDSFQINKSFSNKTSKNWFSDLVVNVEYGHQFKSGVNTSSWTLSTRPCLTVSEKDP